MQFHKRILRLTTKCSKGFTLIELIIGMIIIGILASMTLMQFLSYRELGYSAILQSDLRSVYTTSMQFHLDYPNDAVTEARLEEYGYIPGDEHVTLTIVDGSEAALAITAGHPDTPNIYQVDHAGKITKQ